MRTNEPILIYLSSLMLKKNLLHKVSLESNLQSLWQGIPPCRKKCISLYLQSQEIWVELEAVPFFALPPKLTLLLLFYDADAPPPRLQLCDADHPVHPALPHQPGGLPQDYVPPQAAGRVQGGPLQTGCQVIFRTFQCMKYITNNVQCCEAPSTL